MKIKIKKYSLKTTKEIDNIKIALISDIHYAINYNNIRLSRILEEIKEQHVDYICIVGDLIDDTSQLNKDTKNFILAWLKDLSLISPVIISLGNHDMRYRKNGQDYYNFVGDWYENINNIRNVYLLDNDNKDFKNINFIGYTPSYEYFETREKNYNIVKNSLANICSLKKVFKYNILLSHTQSYLFNENHFDNIDLILCGHTHGGLMPSFVGGNFGLISPTKTLFPKKVRGHISFYNTNIIISSGIIKLSKSTKILYKLTDLFAMEIDIITISQK